MTDTEKAGLEKDVVWERHKAEREFAAQNVKVARIIEKLKELLQGLERHPELVTGTPAPGAPDYRECLDVLNRQEVVNACAELAVLKEKLRTAEKHVRMLECGSPQSRVE